MDRGWAHRCGNPNQTRKLLHVTNMHQLIKKFEAAIPAAKNGGLPPGKNLEVKSS